MRMQVVMLVKKASARKNAQPMAIIGASSDGQPSDGGKNAKNGKNAQDLARKAPANSTELAVNKSR